MKTILLLTCIFFSFFSSIAQSFDIPNIESKFDRWYKLNTAGSGPDSKTKLLYSNDGFIYVYGDFGSELNIDSAIISTSPGLNAFLNKYSFDGTLIWSNYWKGSVSFLQEDNLGNIIVSGTYDGDCSIAHQGGITIEQGNTGDTDVFIYSFNQTGVLNWSKTIRGTANSKLSGMCIKSNNSVLVSGHYFNGTLNLLNSLVTDYTVPAPSSTFYYLEISSTGSSVFGSSVGYMINGFVTIDNNTIVGFGKAVDTNVPFDLSPTSSVYNITATPATGNNLMIVYDSLNNVTNGSVSTIEYNFAILEPDTTILITGSHSYSNSQKSVRTKKIDINGNVLWSNEILIQVGGFPSTGTIENLKIERNSNGGYYIFGTVAGALSFSPTIFLDVFLPNNSNRTFMYLCDSLGNLSYGFSQPSTYYYKMTDVLVVGKNVIQAGLSTQGFYWHYFNGAFSPYNNLFLPGQNIGWSYQTLILSSTYGPLEIDSISQCTPYNWPVTGETYYNDTTFYVINDINGNDNDTTHLLVLVISEEPDSLPVVMANNLLYWNSNGSVIQWYDCDNQTVIQGQNSPYFYPPSSGNYALINQSPNCPGDTTNCYYFEFQAPPILNNSNDYISNICVDATSILYDTLQFIDVNQDTVNLTSAYTSWGGDVYSTLIGHSNDTTYYMIEIESPQYLNGGNITAVSGDIQFNFTDGLTNQTLTQNLNLNVVSSPDDLFDTTVFYTCANTEVFDFINYINYSPINYFVFDSIVGSSIVNPSNYADSIIFMYKTSYLNCTVHGEAVLHLYDQAEVSFLTSNTSCLSDTGEVIASINSSYGIMDFYWSNGDTTLHIDSLSVGVYDLITIDSNYCQESNSALVLNDNTPVSIVETIPSCHASSDGALEIIINGAYNSLVWNNGDTTLVTDSISSGEYWVQVDFGNNCFETYVYNLVSPEYLSAGVGVTLANCNVNNGEIQISPYGGTGPYLVSLNDTLNYTTNFTLSGLGFGLYQVYLKDANNCKSTHLAIINEVDLSQFSYSYISPVCGDSNGIAWVEFDDNGQNIPTSYLWEDGTTNAIDSNLNEGLHYVTLGFNNNLCNSILPIGILSTSPPTQELCIVTVDTSTNFNHLIWEKPVNFVFDYYTIYREGLISNNYEPIAIVDFSDSSEYIDTIAFASEKSWSYFIVATDYCGNSTISLPHKTMYLHGVIQNYNNYQLYWDNYIGISDSLSQYKILRNSNENGWEEIAIVNQGITSYVDYSANGLTNVDYMIQFESSQICTPTLNKNTINKSQSNRMLNDNNLVIFGNNLALEEVDNSSFVIYPNPTTGLIYFRTNLALPNSMIRVKNNLGQVVYESEIIDEHGEVDMYEFEKGIFYIEYSCEDIFIVKKIIKI